MLPSTVDRVSQNTAPEINAGIRQKTAVRYEYLAHSDPLSVAERIEELDYEWDIERALEVNAGTIAFVGAALALLHDSRWAVVPLTVGAFLLQHSLKGWCPPLPILRRLGFRTSREIEEERMGLIGLSAEVR